MRELQLVRKVNVNATDVEEIINHPTIKQFGWFWEDVPANDALEEEGGSQVARVSGCSGAVLGFVGASVHRRVHGSTCGEPARDPSTMNPVNRASEPKHLSTQAT